MTKPPPIALFLFAWTALVHAEIVLPPVVVEPHAGTARTLSDPNDEQEFRRRAAVKRIKPGTILQLDKDGNIKLVTEAELAANPTLSRVPPEFIKLTRETKGLITESKADQFHRVFGMMFHRPSQGISFGAPSSLDIAVVLDVSGSMATSRDQVKDSLKQLTKEVARYSSNQRDIRLGIEIFEDFGSYISHIEYPLSFSLPSILAKLENPSRNLPARQIASTHPNFVRVTRDGEAHYDALLMAIEGFKWRENADKMIVLVTDEPPNPTTGVPDKNGKIHGLDGIIKLLKEKDKENGISVYTLFVNHN